MPKKYEINIYFSSHWEKWLILLFLDTFTFFFNIYLKSSAWNQIFGFLSEKNFHFKKQVCIKHFNATSSLALPSPGSLLFISRPYFAQISLCGGLTVAFRAFVAGIVGRPNANVVIDEYNYKEIETPRAPYVWWSLIF